MPKSRPRAPEAAGTIWYMGAKTRLLDDLEAAIGPLLAKASRRRGPPLFVDLFAGTGVVGAHFADRARVLAADAQRYSCVLARALLSPAPRAEEHLARVLSRGAAIAGAVERRYAEAAAREGAFLGADAAGEDVAARYRAFLEEEIARHDPEADAPAGLVAGYYRNIYFGIGQAAALDGLRQAIGEEGEPERTAFLAALLFAASRATSATAHFAQPRGLGKTSELRAMLARRRIDIRALFDARVRWLASAGRAVAFPEANEARVARWEEVLESMPPRPPAVVYADPPYTQDHYSRFYHVLEVLVDYDAPPLARNRRGEVLKGRYPVLDRRFLSDFSRPERVEDEFRRVTAAVAARGAALVWSYSRTNGLLLRRWGGEVGRFVTLLRESYREVEIRERALRHSGQGDKNHDAVELIAICGRPR